MKISRIFPAFLFAFGISSAAFAQTSVPNTKGSDMPGGTISSNSQQAGTHSTTPASGQNAGNRNAANTAAGGNTTSQNSAPSATQSTKDKNSMRKSSGKSKAKTMR